MQTELKHIYTEKLSDDISFAMILVQGGTFMMGGNDDDARDYEKPVQKLTVPTFYIAKYPVTQRLWIHVMGDNPAYFKGDRLPVESVTKKEMLNFIQNLNMITGKNYDIPQEDEWEFAAQGGIHSEGYLYAGSDKLKEVGWYSENSEGKTQPVGLKIPNELGIYDMSGNVAEWCLSPISTNNFGLISTEKDKGGSFRGGSSLDDEWICPVHIRQGMAVWGIEPIQERNNYWGFRLILRI